MFSAYALATAEHDHVTLSKELLADEWETMVRKDARRATPRTAAGDFLKTHPTATFRTLLEEAKLEEAAAEAGGAEPPYSTWDDAPRFCTTEVRTEYPKIRQPIIHPWTSDEATAELERLFFYSDDPVGFLEGATAADLMLNVFRRVCATPRNLVSHGAVYSLHLRRAVIKTAEEPWYRELALKEFAAVTVPWLAEAIYGICRAVLSGCTNRTPAFVDLAPIVRRVREAMRLLHEPVTPSVTALDVLLAKGDSLAKLKQRSAACKVHSKVSKGIVEAIRDAANDNSLVTFEKLRRIYPQGDPKHPKYAQYKHRIRPRDAERKPILDEKILTLAMKKRV